MNNSFAERIMECANDALRQLEKDTTVAPFLDLNLPIPKPYHASGNIRLIVIGQDPTVQNAARRERISMVLTLDEPDSVLYRYLDTLCNELGLSLRENVYATNACKNFFTFPPTTISGEQGIDILDRVAPAWLPVLQEEVNAFPEATIVSLGQPVLSILVRSGFSHQMKTYWGYHPGWRNGKRTEMCPITPEMSTLGRAIFPFVHQPTQRGKRTEFYRQRREEYIAFLRAHSPLADR